MNIKNTIIILLCATVCTLTSCTAPISAPLEQSCAVSDEEIALKLTMAALENDIIDYPSKMPSNTNLFPSYSDVKTDNANKAKLIAEFYHEILKGVVKNK